jgi:hypothetical protein
VEAAARRGHTRDRSRWVVAAGVVATAVYAATVGGFARYSWPVTVAVVIPGAAAVLWSWRPPADGVPTPGPLDRAGTVMWLATFVSLALWELTSLLLQPSFTTDSYAHPTLSVLSDPFLATHVGRSVALFCWMWLGWSLIRRIPKAER